MTFVAAQDHGCNLFLVSCTVDGGWNLTVDVKCQKEHYPSLDIEGRGSKFWIGAEKIDPNDHGTKKPSGPLCSFNQTDVTYPKVIENLGFDQCGGFPFTSDPSQEYTVYSGWINQRETFNGVQTSEMDEIKVECRLSDVNVTTGDADISPGDEKNAIDTLTSTELVAALDLGLQVGKKDTNGSFTALSNKEKVDVGSTVTVKLSKKVDLEYLFQLKGCKVYADTVPTPLPLYTQNNNFCPSSEAEALVRLVWGGYEEFDLNVFRIQNADKLTFACLVTVYPEGSDDRFDCGKARRRRNAKDSATTVEITKTIDIADDQGSSALPTCANVIVPSIFFMAFF